MSAAKFFDSMIQQAPRYPGDFLPASSKEAVMTRVPASSSQNSQFSAIPPSVRRVMRSRLAEWRLKIPSRLSEFIASSILDLVIPRGQTSQQRHNHGYNNINSNWPSQENWPLEKYIGIKKKEKNCEFCEKIFIYFPRDHDSFQSTVAVIISRCWVTLVYPATTVQ